MSKSASQNGILDFEGKFPNPFTGSAYSEQYKKLGKVWSKYPAYSNAIQSIEDIKNHDVILVVSGTGSGKTVLFPKFTLHALGYDSKIGITLPKQMIAKSAAEFSAMTLDVELGSYVGYQYRGSPKNSKSDITKLLYCTDGTMVARLITDPSLSEFKAVVIDEAHERKVNIDLLLYLLRNTLKLRPDFKIIIMSATIDVSIFEKYFKDFKFKTLEIGGKTNYPIESIFVDKPLNPKKPQYLEEGVKIIKNLIQEIVNTDKIDKIDKSKSIGILFFVTSVSETKDMCDLISKTDPTSNVCISVYSGMNPLKEKLATDEEYFVAEYGNKDSPKIKLVIATNVAESSLTIENIQYVIDSGLELRSRYDNINRIDILEKTYISHAQAKQRMGRTGRTGAGTCYHLYTKEEFDKMERFPEPAIRSESITSDILRLLSMDIVKTVPNLKKVFNEFIEPPNPQSVEADLSYLKTLEMIDKDELSQMGRAIVDLQVEPEEGRALIMAYRLFVFREVSAILALSSAIKFSVPSLFVLPDLEEEDDKKKRKNLINKFERSKAEYNNKYGDAIGLLKIFYQYEELRLKDDPSKLNDWLYEKFIKKDVLDKAYKSYLRTKNQQRAILFKFQQNTDLIPKTDKSILDLKSNQKIISSLMYGYSNNIIHVKNDVGEIELYSKGQIIKAPIELDSVTFMEDSNKSTSKRAIYFKLFKFGDRPIKSKITTFASEKGADILDKLK